MYIIYYIYTYIYVIYILNIYIIYHIHIIYIYQIILVYHVSATLDQHGGVDGDRGTEIHCVFLDEGQVGNLAGKLASQHKPTII